MQDFIAYTVARVRAKAGSAIDTSTGDNSSLYPSPLPSTDCNFLDEIFRVLLHARRILTASYCIGYFIPETSSEHREAHDALQVCNTRVGCVCVCVCVCVGVWGGDVRLVVYSYSKLNLYLHRRRWSKQ